MNTNVIEKGKWERDLEVEVPPERIDRELASALRRYQRRLEIPGFRKGKVPLKVIQQRYGESIRHGVIEDLLPTLMQEAARQTGLVPAGSPRITHLHQNDEGGLRFTAAIDIWPEIEVQGYEGLKVTRLTHEVGHEEVAEQLEELRNRNASERSVERPLARGDVLIADLQRLDSAGLPIVGQRYEERYFHIGADDTPSPEFEEALIGIRAGEERRVRFAYRQDLPNEQLAGKEEHFAVTAREVRERLVPALDDEFAKDVSDRFQTLDQLGEDLRRQLGRRWDAVARQKLRSDLVEGLLRTNPVELPESLVDHYLEMVRKERDEGARRHDHDHDREEAPSAEERETAVRRLKVYVVLEGLRKKIGVEVTDEEFESYLAERAEELGMRLEELKRSPRSADLRRDLEEDKVFGFLEERAVVEEKPV